MSINAKRNIPASVRQRLSYAPAQFSEIMDHLSLFLLPCVSHEIVASITDTFSRTNRDLQGSAIAHPEV